MLSWVGGSSSSSSSSSSGGGGSSSSSKEGMSARACSPTQLKRRSSSVLLVTRLQEEHADVTNDFSQHKKIGRLVDEVLTWCSMRVLACSMSPA
jgi:hypothetical protein